MHSKPQPLPGHQAGHALPKPSAETRPEHRPHSHSAHGALPPPLPGRPAVAPAPGVFDLLLPPLQQALAEEGYRIPTPIQVQAIPHLLAGRDLLGCAQTGTGKTAAFMLPILQHLVRHPRPPARGRPRVLVLAPTRELAAQIGDSIRAYGRHLRATHTVIFGGVGQRPQEVALARGLDIVVATPGRLLDLMNQRFVQLDSVEIFVLDEADRMLDMGFIRDIRRIIATREELSRELTKLGFRVFPSETNFILVQAPLFPAPTWLEKLRDRKILVRWFNQPVVKNYLRITIGTPDEAGALVRAVKSLGSQGNI